MKRILLTLLAVLIALGLFAAVGYSGYRIGYAQGVQARADGTLLRSGLRPFDELGPRGIPGHEFRFGRDFRGAPGRQGFPMLGFGFFPLLGLIALLGLVIWFISWLLTRSGWRLTRTATVTETPPPPAPPAETEMKE